VSGPGQRNTVGIETYIFSEIQAERWSLAATVGNFP
jgi:hypothetical protein